MKYKDGLFRYDPCINCGIMYEGTRHHRRPKTKKKRKGGGEVILCEPCHRHLHANFSNSFIREHLNTADKLRKNPVMKKFAEWRIKHPDKITHSKQGRGKYVQQQLVVEELGYKFEIIKIK